MDCYPSPVLSWAGYPHLSAVFMIVIGARWAKSKAPITLALVSAVSKHMGHLSSFGTSSIIDWDHVNMPVVNKSLACLFSVTSFCRFIKCLSNVISNRYGLGYRKKCQMPE